jgi:heme/copper-type cytochrome/quinol oxidase subunit 3
MTAVTLRSHGAPHAEDPVVVGRRWRTGVLLLIFADVAFVAAMLFSYYYLRGLDTSKAWLAPKQDTAAIWVGWLIAAILVVAAAAFRSGYVGIRSGSQSRLLAGAALASLLVVADAVVQVVQLANFPFGIGDSAYSSELYLLGGANLFHLMLTLFLGIGVWNRSRLGLYSQDDHRQVQIISVWWTWIAVAALATALTTSFIASPAS